MLYLKVDTYTHILSTVGKRSKKKAQTLDSESVNMKFLANTSLAGYLLHCNAQPELLQWGPETYVCGRSDQFLLNMCMREEDNNGGEKQRRK